MIYPIALTLILGIGTCSTDGDWCPGTIAEIGVEKGIYSNGNHEWVGSAVHYSDPRDGTFLDGGKGDRGIETFMLRYKYTIGE
jgi:hypothetical protein